MTPVRLRGLGGLGGCRLQAATRTTATRTARARMTSDVRTALRTIDSDTRPGHQARLLRAEECDHARPPFCRPEAAQGHLAADEIGDALRVRLLPAVPAPALPHHGPGGDGVY